jgi:F-type H+-transporting ATPase subunit epsilon
MAAETIRFEIVTPVGLALHRDVVDVGVPTLDGEIGILPGHVPLLAAVTTGIVSIRPSGSSSADEPQRFAVSHGVLEVAGDKALLLTEKFLKKDDVDVLAVRARLKEVDDELIAWTGDDLRDKHRVELIEEEQWLATQLDLIGDPPQPVIRESTRFFEPEAEVISEESQQPGETSKE